ncbi:MAG: hypothetical protein A2126_01365 [Candidatus Woykebacteria bacterium GWB1_45_5]|uniref:Uncharacterized protein n=1 Tax=Candidatus Woykebacteria bacterium GWB1_45_5 TaxID=1802592 RepID=A0A1G1W8M4_9BACT|nr:MAG: hypothetical protein A2126_01365 [Candidatus Woykebacteria bacterium GWB1_45_5]
MLTCLSDGTCHGGGGSGVGGFGERLGVLFPALSCASLTFGSVRSQGGPISSPFEDGVGILGIPGGSGLGVGEDAVGVGTAWLGVASLGSSVGAIGVGAGSFAGGVSVVGAGSAGGGSVVAGEGAGVDGSGSDVAGWVGEEPGSESGFELVLGL